MRASMAELRRLLDEVAEVDWRHPAWWLAVAGTAILEFGSAEEGDDPEADYISTDGSARADTFMGRTWAAPPAHAPVRIARAIARARAALEAIAAIDGTLPRQPLGCTLSSKGRLVSRVLLHGGPPRAVIATDRGAYLAVFGDDPAGDIALAGDLARVLTGRPPATPGLLSPVDPSAPEPTPAAIAVGVADEPLAGARHLHRRGWTRAGGPWLGVSNAPPLEVISTSHIVVDGYGHALLSSQIFDREDRRELAALIEAARFGLAGAACDVDSAEMLAGAHPVGVATTTLAPEVDFAAMAYALGRTLESVYRGHLPPAARRRARFSPTFQVPVAPGELHDPERRRRRVVPGLMSLRMRDGRFESFDEFRRRVPDLIERERAAAGVFTRMLMAARRVPLPTAVKRRIVASSVEPKSWMPLIEVLAGRGCLSVLRFPAPERPRHPLYAVSSPTLWASTAEALGGTVLTVVQSRDEMAVALGGAGLAGTEIGARAFLDLWQEELSRTRRADGASGATASSFRS
jgi:hypothetical protein